MAAFAFPQRLRAAAVACAAVLAAASLAAPAVAEPYRVVPGDTVGLSIYGQPDLSGPHRVREDGALALHLIGVVPVEGMTLNEVEGAIAEAAQAAFRAPVSVIAEMAAWRDIFVLGDVLRPGAHPFAPGMTAIQAMALAGGQRRLEIVGGDSARRLSDERRRLLLAQARIDEAEATIAAIDAELGRLDKGDGIPADDATASPPGDPAAADSRAALQEALIRSRREVVERAMDGARRQRDLALEEAGLFGERREIVARQLAATETNLADIDTLVARGLARRDRQLALSVNADSYRADALEIAAFEARARQTAVTADNAAAVALSRYRETLVSDRLRTLRDLEGATIEFATSLEYLQIYGDASDVIPSLLPPTLRLELVRGGERIEADELTALRPGDVLQVSFAAPTP